MGGIRFCEQCGSPLPPGSKFCENCGAPVRDETQSKRTERGRRSSETRPREESQVRSRRAPAQRSTVQRRASGPAQGSSTLRRTSGPAQGSSTQRRPSGMSQGARHSAGHPECRREMNFTHARRILHGCGRLRVAGKIRKETGSSHGRGSRWKMKGAA